MVHHINCTTIADRIDQETGTILIDCRRIASDARAVLQLYDYTDARADNRIFTKGLRTDAERFGIAVTADPCDVVDGYVPFGKTRRPDDCDGSLNVDGGGSCPWEKAVVEAALEIIEEHELAGPGLMATVIGRGIGRIIARRLIDDDATVAMTHSHTLFLDRDRLLAISDLVVSAAPYGKTFQASHLKNGASLIDIGANFDYSTVVDIKNFDIHVTPKKDGIGRVTRSIVMNRVAHNFWDRLKREGGH